MRIILFFFIVFLWGIRSASCLDLSDFENEQLHFDVLYKGLNVADAQMWIGFQDSFHTLNWTVDTKNVVQLLFHVNNVYQVKLDSSGRMVQATKSVHQKNIQQEWVIQYNWSSNRAVSNQQYEWPVVKNCFNLLPMLYDLRLTDFSIGDSLEYVLDIESQIWRVKGIATPFCEGNLSGSEIVFAFSPALDIVERAWKTDLITNRMGNFNSTLTIRLGQPPLKEPLLVRFGNQDTQIEMRLKP